MEINISWAAIGVIITVIGHGGFSVWWASKITNQIYNLSDSMNKIYKEFEKRDTQFSAVWARVDTLGNRMTAMEAKCSHEHEKGGK